MPKRLDLAGKVLEFLVVKDFAFIGKDKRSYWNCVCICGKSVVINSSLLFCGSLTSCGCKRRFVYTLRRGMSLKELAYRTIYNDYKSGAKNKNRQFELEFADFSELINSNCFYCGSAPNTSKTVENGFGTLTILYNGIDRKDNNVGYIISNCVTACKICNYAKKAMLYDDFIAWLNRIVMHWQNQCIY